MADERELLRMQKLLEQMMGYQPTLGHQAQNPDYMKALFARSPEEHGRVKAAGERYKQALKEDVTRGATSYGAYKAGVSSPQALNQDWHNELYMSQLRDRDVHEWMKKIQEAYDQQFHARGIEFFPTY